MGRIGFRQALAEVVAVQLADVNKSRLANWRSLGRVPRAERLGFVELAAKHGIALRDEDFENWQPKLPRRRAS